MPGSALAAIDDTFDPNTHIILHPVTMTDEGSFSPVLRESISVVTINVAPDSGEVYNEPRYAKADFRDPSKSRFALTAVGLSKIAAAAGIKWVPEGCDVVERERRGRHVYLRYRATGAVRQPNGEWHLEVAEKEIDTEDVQERMTQQDWRQWEKWAGKDATDRTPWWVKPLVKADRPEVERVIAERVSQQVLQLKEFILGHAETKAKNRVIRRLLDVKQTYAATALAKSFVVPRLVYRPDLTDPRELERVQLEGRRAADELYGGSSPVSSNDAGGPLAEVRSLPDHSSATGAADAANAGAAAPGGPTSGVDAAPAKPTPAASEGPTAPKDDPVFDDGPHKGDRMSYVAEVDPQFLRGLLQNTRAAKKREVIEGWLSYAQPTLGT